MRMTRNRTETTEFHGEENTDYKSKDCGNHKWFIYLCNDFLLNILSLKSNLFSILQCDPIKLADNEFVSSTITNWPHSRGVTCVKQIDWRVSASRDHKQIAFHASICNSDCAPTNIHCTMSCQSHEIVQNITTTNRKKSLRRKEAKLSVSRLLRVP